MEISVIIPVYNAEKYITKSVESALQFTQVKEVILIEDGSPDNGLQICQELEQKYDHVKLLQHPDQGNHGAGASRNLGLANAHYPYIAFLDADDFYLPNRFDKDQKIFSENPCADGVYNAIGIHYYSQEAKDLYQATKKQELTTVNEIVTSKQLFESFISMGQGLGHFHIDGTTLKKEALKKLPAWFHPELKLNQDTEFLIRATYTLQLFPGEIQIPTATRGVHLNNRITNIRLNTKRKIYYQKMLWELLHEWAKLENLPKEYCQQINRIKIIKSLAAYPPQTKWFFFINQVMKDKNLISDPVYYNKIHSQLFGNSITANILHRIINKIQCNLSKTTHTKNHA